MTLIKRLFFRLKSFLFSEKFNVISSNNIPLYVKNRNMYIIGDKGYKWLILFKCPCKCGENINLNLLEESYDKWTYSIKKGKIEITPSIRRTKGCKSHFWIKKGKTVWCSFDDF